MPDPDLDALRRDYAAALTRIDQLDAYKRGDICILSCDSPSYPPQDDEYVQCGCKLCKKHVREQIATLTTEVADLRADIAEWGVDSRQRDAEVERLTTERNFMCAAHEATALALEQTADELHRIQREAFSMVLRVTQLWLKAELTRPAQDMTARTTLTLVLSTLTHHDNVPADDVVSRATELITHRHPDLSQF